MFSGSHCSHGGFCMSQRFTRIFTILILAISTVVLVSLSFDAEARRMGGGRSFGRQSPNIMQQRQAATPPAATTAPRAAATPPAAGARSGAAATNTARTGMSRFLGPIAGIAAGLGIAALLSAMGLSGAFLEMLSSLILIGLLVFGVMFIVRRLRGGAARPATHGASPMQRQSTSTPDWQRPLTPSASGAATAQPAVQAEPAQPVDESWFIPENFDTPGFLDNAKGQFVKIQSVWDSGDVEQLREYLTDDLIAEIKPELQARAEGAKTEVVLLNAELMGIETVSGGHLASIRYSGMLRESADAEAFRFEEVWNLYKAENEGWLLAGIQQIPSGSAS